MDQDEKDMTQMFADSLAKNLGIILKDKMAEQDKRNEDMKKIAQLRHDNVISKIGELTAKLDMVIKK